LCVFFWLRERERREPPMNGSVGVVQGLYFSNAEGMPDDKM
jgi:hypothetical protein